MKLWLFVMLILKPRRVETTMEVEQQLRSGNSGDRGVAKDIVEATMTNEGKKVKWRCELKNKLIIFTYT